MSGEDTPRPWPDSSEGSHCGRGFEGGLGVADPASRLLDVLTVQILSPRWGGVRGVSGPGRHTTVLRAARASPLWP